MKDEIFNLKSTNPFYTNSLDVKFEDYYKMHSSMKIPINKQKGNKQYINKSNEDKCCFCGVKNIGDNFKNESHIIPAAFGNRTFFSNEECDNCNNKFGIYDTQLSDMFLIERLLHDIPNRDNKIPKYKSNSENGSIVENLGLNTILFVNNEDQYFKDIFDKNPKKKNNSEILLKSKYRPLGVAKSLVHMMWLLLEDKTRKKNKKLLDWFSGKNDIFPIFLNYGKIKELHNRIVTFTIWEKYKTDDNYADFILVFAFSNNIILFEVPCFNCNEYKPCILPPLILETEIGKIDLEMIRLEIKSNNQAVDGRKSIKFETTDSTHIGNLDLKGNTEIDHVKEAVKRDSEFENLKKYIIEINNYFKVCIPFSIKLDEVTKNHIYNLVLCAKYEGRYTFEEVKSYKVKMNNSFTKIIDAINTKELPFIKISENKIFKVGSIEIKYTLTLNITNPSCRKSKNKMGIEFVNFRGEKIIETLTII